MISLLLESIIQKDNLTVQKGTPLRDVIDLMNVNQKGVVALLDGEIPVGILTERDVVEILYNHLSFDEEVSKYSKRNPVTTQGDRPIGHAMNLMIENNIRRVVVTDSSGIFLGIVTQQDLLKHLEEDVYQSSVKVKHIIEKLGDLISVTPDDTLERVLERFVKNRISSVTILNEGKAVGIITEKDILKLANSNVSLDSRVDEYMSTPVVTATLDTILFDIVKRMNDGNIRRMVIIDDAGLAINMLTIRDVLRNLEGDYNKYLEKKLKSAKDILNLLPEMLIEVTDSGDEQLVIWANEKVLNSFGHSILDKPVTDFIPPESWKPIYQTIQELQKIENFIFKKNDRVYELSGFYVVTEGTFEKGRFQLIIRDITEDVRQSTTDSLTSVYNRRFINEFLLKEIERSKRSKDRFSVVICDLDDFKKINDTYGHISGDIVLKSFCQVVTGTLRKLDVIGRYGGDEFVLVLPNTSTDIACMIVNRLKDSLAGQEITTAHDVKVTITASFGVANYPVDGLTSEDLLVKSDDRLYKAKSMGKNQVICVN